jgi:hypothetical protein
MHLASPGSPSVSRRAALMLCDLLAPAAADPIPQHLAHNLYMGDGVLVFLGYPQAHEDDAERAVRAGLELVAAVGAPTECPRSLRYSTATSAPYAVGKPRAARALPATRVPHLARKQRRIGEELCHCSPD